MSARPARAGTAPVTPFAELGELVACPNGNVFQPSCKKRTCPFCGPRWAKRWRKVMFVNLEAYGGKVVMISVTPPGENRLPWDDEHCSHPRGGRHSGKRGCRAQQRAAREWSETASLRYSLLRRAASVHVRRHAPAPVNLLERVWEPQKRGVPHLHLVVGVDTPAELEAAAEFVGKLKELAPEYDFGFVDARGSGTTKGGHHAVVRGEKLKLISPQEAARYLSSYLTGRSKYKPSIRETVADPAMSALTGRDRRQSLPLIWLTPRLTKLTRVTMRTLRRAGHLWAWSKGLADEGPKWVDALEAAASGIAYRLAYARRGEADEPPPFSLAEAAAAIELARDAQARFDALETGYDKAQQKKQLAAFMDELALSLAGIKLPEPAIPALQEAAA